MAEIGKNLQIIITNNEKTDKISFDKLRVFVRLGTSLGRN